MLHICQFRDDIYCCLFSFCLVVERKINSDWIKNVNRTSVQKVEDRIQKYCQIYGNPVKESSHAICKVV